VCSPPGNPDSAELGRKAMGKIHTSLLRGCLRTKRYSPANPRDIAETTM
jgi:hypothetical protein